MGKTTEEYIFNFPDGKEIINYRGKIKSFLTTALDLREEEKKFWKKTLTELRQYFPKSTLVNVEDVFYIDLGIWDNHFSIDVFNKINNYLPSFLCLVFRSSNINIFYRDEGLPRFRDELKVISNEKKYV